MLKFSSVDYESSPCRILLNVLEKDALPSDVDYDIRQSAYLIALQVLCFNFWHLHFACSLFVRSLSETSLLFLCFFLYEEVGLNFVTHC